MRSKGGFSFGKALGIVLSALIVAGSGVCGSFYVKGQYFSPNTFISGIEVSSFSPEEAINTIESAANDRILNFCDESGELLGSFSLSDALVGIDIASQVNSAFVQQKTERGFFQNKKYTQQFSLDLSVDHDNIETFLQTALMPEIWEEIPPTDAQLVINDNGVYIEKDKNGSVRNISVCADALKNYLQRSDVLTAENPTSLWVDNALIHAEVTADSQLLLRREAVLSHYTNLEIKIEFCGGREYIITLADLWPMLNIEYTSSSVRVTVNEEGIRTVVDRVVEELGADGVMAKYGNTCSTRNDVYIPSSDTGFTLNRDKLVEDIAAALRNRHSGIITTEYDYMAWLRKKWGYMGDLNSIVEVSIENQYEWFYSDGVLLTETVITTGDVATGCDTPKGAFFIRYATSDCVLNGPTWSDHVDFWIPYFEDYGLHDSSWRENYGGDVYLTEGSHGCVNTPWEPMSIIFNNIRWNTVVIVR